MKIRILTALWQRPGITRICFEGIKRLQQHPDFEIQATATASENGLFAPLCEEYGIEYVHCNNKPLGLKWHTGLQACMKHDFDFLMLLGSDDLISSSLLDIYKPLCKEYFVFGVEDLYLYSVERKKTVYYPGYEKIKMSIGAGRMIHREVIEACKGKLWPFRINRGLDGNSLRRIRAKGYDEHVINVKGKAAIVDIKSRVNLNEFGSFYGEPVDNSELNSIPEMKAVSELKL